jgi:hypothetical protein
MGTETITRMGISTGMVMGTITGMSMASAAGMSRAFSAALLLLVLPLAPPSPASAQATNETLRAEDAYRECLFLKSRKTQYARDDRESDFGLLGECRKQWVVYMDVCEKAGFDTPACVMKSRLVIHAILNLTGK